MGKKSEPSDKNPKPMDKNPKPPLSKKEKAILLKPRIGFESIGQRLAGIWAGGKTGLVVKGLKPEDLLGPINASITLEPDEMKAEEAWMEAGARFDEVHGERMQHLDKGWRNFLMVYDFVKPLVKHDPYAAQELQFVIDFMSLPKTRGQRRPKGSPAAGGPPAAAPAGGAVVVSVPLPKKKRSSRKKRRGRTR
jgi:hypothetical protein